MNDFTEKSSFRGCVQLIVVGGGHAGAEAALIAARMGIDTLLITARIDAIARMPCNPSIGGLAKSHLVYEIDALGGEMGRNADCTALQSKTLNLSRGPAVHATRAQCAKREYTERMQWVVSDQPHLQTLEDTVIKVIVENNICKGVVTSNHGEIFATCVVITSGTSLRGRTWIGNEYFESGGDDRPAINLLSESLSNLGFRLIRLKTGTPPRLKAASCDFSACIRQDGDINHPLFHMEHSLSERSTWNNLPEFPCWMTHTTQTTHEIIRENLKTSALYGGNIVGTGVRYCPSIEDKIVRFNATQHHVMLEPEDSNGDVIYPNGLSCSLPKDVQKKIVHSVPGLQDAEFLAYAYAIEYDSIDARELNHTLQSKRIENLFFAGQVNGTTGYEEAAGQGIMAGINAALKIKSKAPLVFSRHDAYIGVMIDDLVTKGTDEPYRMFTSRAERRLLLRQDNTFFRLSDAINYLNVRPRKQLDEIKNAKEFLETCIKTESNINPARVPSETHGSLFTDDYLMYEYGIMRHYAPYIEQEKKAAEKAKLDEAIAIPKWLNYDKCTSIRYESREKLKLYRPETLAQASHVPGVNPADVSLLAIIIKRGHI